ncbi:MAG: hypothetical protein Q9219_007407 [cf. Caloplaca sp. 3 TL-2023]
MAPRISGSATRGFANASSYDTHRPSYPPEAVDDLLAKLQVRGSTNARIVEVGAGTGKFSQLLAARGEKYDIIAVEPHEEMRRHCEAKKLDRVQVVDGVAIDLPVESQSVDAVIVAQVDNAPWTWEPRTAWEATMKNIVWSYDDQHPRFRHENWRQVFDKQLSSTPFTIQSADPLFSLPLGEGSVEFVYYLHPDAIWKRFQSLSQIAVLEGEELTSVKDKVFAAMAEDNIERKDNNELPLHGRVVYTWTSSVPGAPLKNSG